MRIVIETDGSKDGTRLFLNGKEQLDVIELEFQVSTLRGKSGRPCLHLLRGDEHGKPRPDGFARYFGNDFAKYDGWFPEAPKVASQPAGGSGSAK